MTTEKLPADHPGYHKQYYRAHRDEIAEKKKKKYETDSQYRKEILRRSRVRKAAQRQAREEAKATAKAKDPMEPKKHTVSIGGREITVLMYSISQLARCFGRTAQTVRLWEKKGHLPKATYRCNNGNRLYTEFQVKMLVAAYFAVIEEHERLVLSQFSKNASEIWKNYPYGIEE